MIIGATNKPALLDRALFRRFDDVLTYDVPDAVACQRLIENTLGTFRGDRLGWKSILKESEGLSHAEIDHACLDAIKVTILNDQKTVLTETLTKTLHERKQTHKR